MPDQVSCASRWSAQSQPWTVQNPALSITPSGETRQPWERTCCIYSRLGYASHDSTRASTPPLAASIRS